MNESIIIAIIGSGVLSTIVSAIITAISNRRSRLKKIEAELVEINAKLEKSEKDTLRTQLLLLISDYPNEKAEIMTLAQHYFGGLHGNWYLSSLFNTWLERSGIARPEWFKAGERI